MKFSTIVLSAVAISTASAAVVDDYYNWVTKYKTGTVVPVYPRGAAVRWELNDLPRRSPIQFTLLILALQQMQNAGENDPLSYYGLSQVHGRPFGNWNSEPNCNNCPKTAGYCTHNSLLFATWHRPYLSLFEQYCWRAAYHALKNMEAQGQLRGQELQQWQTQLEQFRIPFWSWTDNRGAIPSVAMSAQIEVTMPGNKKQNVQNPLYQYSFKGGNSKLGWARNMQQTQRSPGKKQEDSNNLMKAQWSGLSQGLYDMVMNTKDYTNYGSMINKLESLHNTVHGAVGNGGHMSYIDVAAFDPIFWFHHVNIDRIFDMWLVTHQRTGFRNASPNKGTWAIPPGSTDNDQQELYPFHSMKWSSQRNAHAYYTSGEVMNDPRTEFGYYYPETQNRDANTVRTYVNKWVTHRQVKRSEAYDPSKEAAAPSAPVEETETETETETKTSSEQPIAYGNTKPETETEEAYTNTETEKASNATNSYTGSYSQSNEGSGPYEAPGAYGNANLKPSNEYKDELPDYGSDPFDGDMKDFLGSGEDNQWKATINADPHACGTSYFVHLFVGEPSENPTDWYTQKELVGSYHVFTMAGDAKFASNDTMAGNSSMPMPGSVASMDGMPIKRIVEGQIMLSNQLLNHPKISGLCPSIIEPYLEKNLRIRVQLATGEEVPLSEVPSLKVGIISQKVTAPSSPTGKAEFGEQKEHRKITKDIAGGLSRCDLLGLGKAY